jgi:phospholipid transport system substrate-binding protein
VRYGKDDLALKSLAGNEQGRRLLGEAWEKASAKERAHFVSDFQALFAALAFPKIRKAFEHLETIVYDTPKVDGGHATIQSTLVVLHPLKKREIRVRYELVRVGTAWKVADVQVLGTGRPSMLQGIRDEQIVPLLKEGGLAKVLQVMDARLAQVREKK